MTTTTTTLVADQVLDGGEAATAFQLDKTYVDGSAFQWAAEWLRNVVHVHDRMTADGVDTTDVKAVMDFVQSQTYTMSDGALVSDPVLRRAWNVGQGMKPIEELLEFYSRINKGGGANRWSPKNLGGAYGMGVRAALLYWTDVLFVTSVPGEGVFGIVLRHRTRADGSSHYGVARVVEMNEDGPFVHDGVVPGRELFQMHAADSENDPAIYLMSPEGSNMVPMTLDLVPDEMVEKGGFAAIFLGKGEYVNDIDYDHNRDGETHRGIGMFLTNRFKNGSFPVEVAMRVKNAGKAAAGRIRQRELTHTAGPEAGAIVYFDTRALKPLSDWTDRAEKLAPVSVDAHGTTVTPYLLPEDYFHTGSFTDEEKDDEAARDSKAKFEYRSDGTWGKLNLGRDGWYPFMGKGQVVVAFKDEVYSLRETDGDNRSKLLSQWGISKESVARRVLLVIEPPIQGKFGPSQPWGITQNAARSFVQGPGGSTLPIQNWQAEFLDHFPKAISDALAVRPVGKARLIPEDEIARLRERALGAKAPRKAKTAIAVEANETEAVAGEDGELDGGEAEVSAGEGKHKGSGKDGAVKNARTITPGKGGLRYAKRRPTLPEPPQPEFIEADKWIENGWPEEQFARVNLMGGGYEIVLNRGHAILQRQIDYFWNDQKKGYFSHASRKRVLDRILRNHGGARDATARNKAETQVISELEYVYRHDALSTFLGAMSIYVDNKGRLDRNAFNNAMTNGEMTMTVGLSAIYPQESTIADRLNSIGQTRKSA